MSKKNEEKKCPICLGEGKRICPTCHGLRLRIPAISTFGFPTTCCICGGTGNVQCNVCNGTGNDISISFKM